MKTAIMTIDTESHVGRDPVEKLIWGKTEKGERLGIERLMDLCDKFRVKALFFVDIAEAWDYGEEKIAEVLRAIEKRGHDVGVHIHPDHMADKKRLFLWEYTYEEQYEIIKKCTDFYISVLGKKPKAFRAGKYGADQNTLTILSELGYRFDFSEFYGQKWCGIDPPVCGSNSAALKNGLIEIPTTSYQNKVKGVFNRYDKLDAGMSLSEYKYVFDLMSKDDYTDPIVLFAHSFSLLNWRRKPDLPKKNGSAIRKLEKMLDFATKDPGVRIVSLDDLNDRKFDEQGRIRYHTISGARALLYMIPRAISVAKMRFDLKLRKQ